MPSFEETLARMKGLYTYGNEVNESSNLKTHTLEHRAVAADGITYGIIKENSKYYIKSAPKGKETIAEAYEYLGGFCNKGNYEYTSYSNALKQFELKLASINEAQDSKVNIESLNPFRANNVLAEATDAMRDEIARQRQIMYNASMLMNESTEIGADRKDDVVKFDGKQPEAETGKRGDEGGKKVNAEPEYAGSKTKGVDKKVGPFDQGAGNPKDQLKEGEDIGDAPLKPNTENWGTEGIGKGREPETIGWDMDGQQKVNEEENDWASKGLPSTPGVGEADTDHNNDPFNNGINENEEFGDDDEVSLEDDDATADDDEFDFGTDDAEGDDLGAESEDEFSGEDGEDLGAEGDDEFSSEEGDDLGAEGDDEFADDLSSEDEPAAEGNEDLLSQIEDLQAQIDALRAKLDGEQGDDLGAEGEDLGAEGEDELSSEDGDELGVEGPGDATDDGAIAGEEPEFDGENAEGEDFDGEDFGSEEGEDTLGDDDDIDECGDGTVPMDNAPMFESKKAFMNKIVESVVKDILNEDELHVFGKHPGYRKKPMELPTTGEDKNQWGEDWNDESVHSEEPFGAKIGNGDPFNKLVDTITKEVVAQLRSGAAPIEGEDKKKD